MTLLPILLSDGFVPKVSANDKVAAGDIIAQKGLKGGDEVINVAKLLAIKPQKISGALKKNLGDGVTEGEILAVKNGALVLRKKQIISKFSGTVVKIDEESGVVYIRTQDGEKGDTIISPVAGIVDSCNNEKIVIKTDKEAVIAEDSLGGEQTGELLYIEHFDQDKLTKEIEDKVLLAKQIDKVSLYKAIGLNAAGVIIQQIEDVDFVDLTERNMIDPVMIINEADFKRLSKLDGKKVYLNGKDKSIIVV